MMEPTIYLRFFLALVLVLGLILALAWILRRIGYGPGGGLTRHRRLRLVESALIDGRHRVVLVRRDDVEHLLLVGPNTSQVVERSIPAPPPAQFDATEPERPSFRKFLGRTAS
jgi:flagellar protein FliO/FliZ